MNETIDDNKIESQPLIIHVVEGSITSRMKEITKRPKCERSSTFSQFFNTRRCLVNPEAQQRIFGPIRRFYYRSFCTISKLYTFTEGFDKKPTIFVLHQLIRNGNAYLRVKG
ncbi:unnamed protein product [Rotaria sp. Silwood1]|nr:unnamed protein product [Rotaria sp. Silwood1]